MTIFIGNLNEDIGDREFANLCNKFGKIVYARVIRDRYSNRSRGYGLVKFQNESDEVRACENLKDKEVAGKKLIVSISNIKPS